MKKVIMFLDSLKDKVGCDDLYMEIEDFIKDNFSEKQIDDAIGYHEPEPQLTNQQKLFAMLSRAEKKRLSDKAWDEAGGGQGMRNKESLDWEKEKKAYENYEPDDMLMSEMRQFDRDQGGFRN